MAGIVAGLSARDVGVVTIAGARHEPVPIVRRTKYYPRSAVEMRATPTMTNTYTAIFERDGDWYIAYCPEVPRANGQGRTKNEARASLASAIELVFEERGEN